MSVLGLIPARGGSQRAPRKNVADLNGKPLIGWTIDAAEASRCFDRLVVSTDDPEIAEVACSAGVAILDRPANLSTADAPMLPVVKHASRQYPEAKIIALLQPTSPFRSAEDIIKALSLLQAFNGDSVISVTDVPHDLVFEIGHAGRLRERPEFVTPNGAIYLITKAALDAGDDWYSGICYAYRMPKERSLDIDTPLDLEIARTIAKQVLAA